MRQVGGAESQYSQHPYPKVGDPQMEGYLWLQSFFPISECSEPHIRLSSSGVLHWKDKPPEHLALKTSGAYFWTSKRAVGNRDSILKGHTQN